MIFRWLKKLLNIKAPYISEADQRLQAFDAQHPTPSESQRHEIKKHQNIFRREA